MIRPTTAEAASGRPSRAVGIRGQMATGLSSVRYQGSRNSRAIRTCTTARPSIPCSRIAITRDGTSVVSQSSWNVSARRDGARTAK